MKKWLKFVGLSVGLTATVFLVGFADEAKHNSFKEYDAFRSEVIDILVEVNNVMYSKMKYKKLYTVPGAQNDRYYGVWLEEKEKRILEKLDKMEFLSKDDEELADDYLHLKQVVEMDFHSDEDILKKNFKVFGEYYNSDRYYRITERLSNKRD